MGAALRLPAAAVPGSALRYARPAIGWRRIAPFIGALLLLTAAAPAEAQTTPAPADKDAAVILVFDASKSMRDDDGSGRPKIEAAKEALNELVDELPDDAKVGLRVYGAKVSGSGKAEGCRDTELVAPVKALDRPGLKTQIDALVPRGFTPIGASLEVVVGDLGTAKQKTIVLISDGGDNCAPPAPCGVAKEISKQGVALKIQAVGFRVKAGARRQLECIADAGGGRYVDADNADELGSQLRSLTARALRPYVTQGKRLEGVPGPAQAKLYAPGQYTTDVPINQPTWYSFKVAAGQSISASATLPSSDAGIPSIFKLELQDESLSYEDSDIATNSDTVLTTVTQAEVGEDEVRNPPQGRFFLKVEIDPAEGQSGPYPIELAVRVTGTPIKAPAKSGSEDEKDSTPLASGGAGSADDTSDIVLAAGGVGGVLVGLLAGVGLAGRGRRRTA